MFSKAIVLELKNRLKNNIIGRRLKSWNEDFSDHLNSLRLPKIHIKWFLELLIPKALIPKVWSRSNHIFCLFVTVQTVETVWKDWNRTLTQMIRIKVGGSFHVILYPSYTWTVIKGWNALYLWRNACIPEQTYLNLLSHFKPCRI